MQRAEGRIRVTESALTARWVALVTASGLAIIAAFQLALAIGMPWGRAAYGGTSATLVPELRVASGVATVVWLLAALVVLGRAGYWGSARWSGFLPWATWVVAVLLLLGALVNFASSSPWERFGWGPLALLLAILCVVLARSRAATPSA
jgi:hypothetical protein